MKTTSSLIFPPKPSAVLRIGVVGHRHDPSRFPETMSTLLQNRMVELLQRIDSAAEAARQGSEEFFTSHRARLSFVSALAEGSDRCGARAALQLAVELQVILPFERKEYSSDFSTEGSKIEYATLLRSASRVIELPGSRESAASSYLLAGQVTIKSVDILIAIWDGELGNGLGGTADIVEQGLKLGVPVVHVDVFDRDHAKIRWLGWLDLPANDLSSITPVPARSFDANVGQLVEILMKPPHPVPLKDPHAIDVSEEKLLKDFFGTERMWRWRWRPEQALFQFVFGSRGIRRTDFRTLDYLQATEGSWGSTGQIDNVPGFLPNDMRTILWPRFAWADNLANYYGQYYRSGYISNFFLAALAVICSIVGLVVWHDFKTQLVIVELFVLILIISNTWLGNRRRWHRRWLDYRHLAERLRNLRFAVLLGNLNLIPESVTATAPSWVAWYARATAREMGVPSIDFMQWKVPDFGRVFVLEQLDPQIEYHAHNELHLHSVEHRLHMLGNCAFVLTIAFCFAYLAAQYLKPFGATTIGMLILQYGVVFTISLPAIATALYGIKTQGEFCSRAERSHRTMLELTAIRLALQTQTYSFNYLQIQVEKAASVMLDDLADWRVTYGRRRLENPA